MAKNERSIYSDTFSAPVPTGTKSGDPVLVYGAIPAVANTNEGSVTPNYSGNIAGRASVQTKGVFDLPVADAVSTEGTAIYITGNGTAAGTLTTTASGNTLFGRTVGDALGNGATKSAGAGTVHVRIAKA